jgi:hypothetical protein
MTFRAKYLESSCSNATTTHMERGDEIGEELKRNDLLYDVPDLVERLTP